MALHVHVGVPDARGRDPARERAARQRAGPARPVGQLSVLAGARQRLRLHAHGHLPGLPAHRAAAGPSPATPTTWTRSTPDRARGPYRDPSFFWWDVRPQPRLGTVEVRVMDAQSTVADVAPLVALIQSLALSRARGRPAASRRRRRGSRREPLPGRARRHGRAADRPASGRLVPVREMLDMPCSPVAARTRWRWAARASSNRCTLLAASNGARPSARARRRQRRLDHLVATWRTGSSRRHWPRRRSEHRSHDSQLDRKERLMCRWLAYSGSPILIKEALYTPAHSLVDQSLHSRLGAETDQRRRLRRRLVRRRPDTPGVFHSTEPAWNDQQPARARRPHQLAALLHPHPRGDRQRRAADQLPPLPPRALAVHAQRLHQRVRHDQARPRPRRRPVAVPEDPGPDRHRGAVLPRADLRPARTTRRPPIEQAIGLVEAVGSRHGVPHPFQGTIATTDGESIWAFRYSSEGKSRSLFYTTDVPTLRKLYPETRAAPGALGRRAADRLRTARRRRRRLERGARGDLRHRRPRPRRDAPFQPKAPASSVPVVA